MYLHDSIFFLYYFSSMKVLLTTLAILYPFAFSVAQPKYEFRAAWIATVANIDWPSRGNYDTESQKDEYIKLLDLHVLNGLNAVIVQIRPSTDAFYPSPYEPWSQWLTGEQGRPPSPYYDPLQFMIDEAHKRGLEFHAWCNPYRALMQIGKSSVSPTHVTKIHPEWFLDYGNKRYFDPGNKEAQQFVVNVVRDIVKRYDVDAVHFDDYFYPYRIAGKEFPDDPSYAKYGSGMDRGDWRRSNVDSIIIKLGTAIKQENPRCKFGISPFGVWRNKNRDSLGSDTKAGQTNYDDLYADILLWLKEGYIDYVVPQLYWEHGHSAAPYEELIDWWNKNAYHKHCYVGLGIYKAGTNARWRDKNIIPMQIRDAREHPNLQGQVYFSSKSFLKNPNGWNDSLKQHYYKYPALIPPMYWIDSVKPGSPLITGIVSEGNLVHQQVRISAEYKDKNKRLRKFALYAFPSTGQTDISARVPVKVVPCTTGSASYVLNLSSLPDSILAGKEMYLGFSAVDVNNVESDISTLKKLQRTDKNALWEIVSGRTNTE